MCGRARCTLAPEAVCDAVQAPRSHFRQKSRYKRSSNAFPGMCIPAALQLNGKKFVLPVTWGLVPAWTKRGKEFEHFKMFNARSETVANKTVFSRLVNSKRCVVVADSFYEWTATAAGKQPWSVQRKDGNPIMIAALYDVYRGPLPEKEAAHLQHLDSSSDEGAEKSSSASSSSGPKASSSYGGLVAAEHADAAHLAHHPHHDDGDVISDADGSEPEGEHDGSSAGSAGRATSSSSHSAGSAVGGAGESAAPASAEAAIEDLEHAYVSVTLLTTSPVPELAWLHDRMPVILEEADVQRWLDCEHVTFEELVHPTAPGARSVLRPASGMLSWYPCDRRMNTLAYQAPDAGSRIDDSAVAPAGVPGGGKASAAATKLAAAAAAHKGPTLTAFFGKAQASPGKKGASESLPSAASSASAGASRPSATSASAAASGTRHGDHAGSRSSAQVAAGAHGTVADAPAAINSDGTAPRGERSLTGSKRSRAVATTSAQPSSDAAQPGVSSGSAAAASPPAAKQARRAMGAHASHTSAKADEDVIVIDD